MYKAISGISAIIRWYVFYSTIEQLSVSDDIWFNLLVPMVISATLHPASYGTVGLFYSRGDGAAIGSFLYLLINIIYVFCVWGALMLFSWLNWFMIDTTSLMVIIAGALVFGFIIITTVPMLIRKIANGGAC